MGTNRIGEHDGVLCVVCRDPGWEKPEWVTVYYPVGNGYGEPLRAYDFTRNYGPIDDGWIVEESRCFGYTLRARNVPGFRPIALTLQHGGKTTPIHAEREPMPAPWRAHKGFRAYWRDGRWYRESLRTGRVERAA